MKESGRQKISNTEFLSTSELSYGIISVVNPFNDVLSFGLSSPQKTTATIIISDAHGKTVRSVKQSLDKGLNNLRISDLRSLTSGTYILQVLTTDGIKSRRIVKVNN
jgi:hypothetical protein